MRICTRRTSGGGGRALKQIKKMSIYFSRGKNRRAREKERKLKEELERETGRIDEEEENDLNNYIQIKEELKGIEQRRCMGAIVRSRARRD